MWISLHIDIDESKCRPMDWTKTPQQSKDLLIGHDVKPAGLKETTKKKPSLRQDQFLARPMENSAQVQICRLDCKTLWDVRTGTHRDELAACVFHGTLVVLRCKCIRSILASKVSTSAICGRMRGENISKKYRYVHSQAHMRNKQLINK